jgi:protocatechuate 3,4-dioxygenase beta subunit
MEELNYLGSRRGFLRRVGAGVAAVSLGGRWFERGAFAEEVAKRVRTPGMTEGPFFPDRLPLDTDNDLLIVNDAITPAVGEVTHLTGRVLDAGGSPVRNALIEIWQVDARGCYLHTGGVPRGAERDGNFQGYGRFCTGSTGEYYFRTIKPVAYPGRTPHIHVKVRVGNEDVLTTQFYVEGEKRNERDGVLRGVRDERARRTVMSEYVPVEGSKTGELAARYEVVLGVTPAAP